MRLARLLRLPLIMIALALGGLALASPAAASSSTHTATTSTAVTSTAVTSTAVTHHALSTVHVTGGSTSLTVDKATAGVLTKNGVSVKPIAGARAAGTTFTFPITGGSVNGTTAAGTISHRGGLKFAAGKVSVSVQDFVVDTTRGVLTARVSGTSTRIPLLKLDASHATISHNGRVLTVSNVRATLTSQAAAALNKTFKVSLFTAGLPIGTAKVSARY